MEHRYWASPPYGLDIPYMYCGEAEDGSLTSEPVWHIQRLLFDPNLTIKVAANVKWDDYLTLTYT